MNNYLNSSGLSHLWSKIVEYVSVNGGKIDTIKQNGEALPIADKTVNITAPTITLKKWGVDD